MISGRVWLVARGLPVRVLKATAVRKPATSIGRAAGMELARRKLFEAAWDARN